MPSDFFRRAAELERAGRPFATVTVVRIERPTSGKPGDRALVTADGELHGWVGGSCARPTAVEEALAALRDGRPRLVRLSNRPQDEAAREGITDLAMTCFSGGTMEIYIEPQLPPTRLLLVGDQPVARALAELARVLGYQVVAAGPGSAALSAADERVGELAAIAEWVHPLTYVVIASHGDHDEVAVEYALEAGAAYVGLVASRKRAASIRKYLGVRGLDETRLAALRAPAGLDLGVRRPEEIALSILAEIVQLRVAAGPVDWPAEAAASTGLEVSTAAERPGESTSEKSSSEAAAQPVGTAVDPICGMSVKISGAQHVHVHAGVSYYFCCGGCLARFATEPERYLA